MKRFIALVLSLLLLLSVFSVAGAEGERTVKARDFGLNKLTGTFYCRPLGSDFYQVVDIDGNVLSDPNAKYKSMYANGSYPFFKVEVTSADGVHDEGLLDGNGQVVVPAVYADINIISDRWQAGVKLTSSSADEKDYTFTNWSTGEKNFYRVDTVDIYFDGELVGTLNRSEYGGGSCTAYNAYICFTNMERERVYYNSKMEKSPVANGSYGEFDSQYNKGVYTYTHQGSGQKAFVSTCTLDPADLVDPYMYDRGEVFDVQGNVLFKTAQAYDTVQSFKNGYASVRIRSKYGLIDLQGNEVIEPVYDRLGNYEDKPLEFGYISAVKDGKFGFVDANGNETTPFVYSEDIVNNRTTFATIKNLDGTTIVLSGAVGELAEHFADVSFPNYYGCKAFVGQNENNQYCVVDIYGNTILPYNEGYRNIYLTPDGSIALVYYGSQEYGIFTFDIQPPAENPDTPDDTDTTGPADDGSWTCENGHSGNTGKFCTECGAAKPVEEEKPAFCSNCGYAFGDKVPSFCPECGTKVE